MISPLVSTKSSELTLIFSFQAKHLTRAISALLRLTPDEERLLQQHLEWKTSWFGQKPKLGSGQFALSLDPH